LTLLVDGGCEVVNEFGARLVSFRRDLQHLGLGAFCLRILGEFKRAVCNHNPRRAPDGHLRARIFINDPLGGGDGGAKSFISYWSSAAAPRTAAACAWVGNVSANLSELAIVSRLTVSRFSLPATFNCSRYA